MSSITSSNSIVMLAITDLFPAPIKLEGYSADDAFTSDNIAITESVIGVDGHHSAGFIHNLVKMKVKLSPDSRSILIFDAWNAAMQLARDVYFATAIIELPGIGATYAASRGVLSEYKGLPDAGKTLKPIEFTITWESIVKAQA